MEVGLQDSPCSHPTQLPLHPPGGARHGVPQYSNPLTNLPHSPAPVSCLMDCLALLSPIPSSQASPTQPPPLSPFSPLPVSAAGCLYLPIVADTPEEPRLPRGG